MSTLTGVIKASTKLGTDVVPAESDLWGENYLRLVTTQEFPQYSRDSTKSSGYFLSFLELAPNISVVGGTEFTFEAELIPTVLYGQYASNARPTVAGSEFTFEAALIKTVSYGNYDSNAKPTVRGAEFTFEASLVGLVIDVNTPHEVCVGGYLENFYE